MTGILVAGGGPAGASAALLLARAGRDVTVIEREAAPANKVCGEFVAGDALGRLAALGIDLAALGARPITRLRVVRARDMAQADLPFAAMGLSRRRLDAALLQAAEAAGATVRRGHAIRRLHGGVVSVDGLGDLGLGDLGLGDLATGGALFLATGKHELRGVQRPAGAHATVGLKMHLTLAPSEAAALDGAIELLLFRDTYAGLQRIEDGLANLCLVAPQSRLAADGGWDGLLDSLCRENPHLGRRLQGASGWAKPLAIARVPYGFVHAAAAADVDGGWWRLGDQMGVIHSFTGDGIAIALHTASLAASCFLAGLTPSAYHARARADIRGPIRLASGLYRAGRSAMLQAAMMGVARLWPGVLGQMAGLTRAGWAA